MGTRPFDPRDQAKFDADKITDDLGKFIDIAFGGIFDNLADRVQMSTLKATEARKRTDTATARLNAEKDKNITLILAKVLDAADKGESSYKVNSKLSNYEEGKLTEMGYVLKHVNEYQETYTLIKW